MKKVISIFLTVLMVAVCIPFAETNASTNQNPTFVMKKENWGLQKWGELSFADNAVTASVHLQSLYTTVDGFEPNTKYSLSFNVSAGDKITRTWVIEPGEDLSKAECWVNANSGTYNGTKTDLTVPGTFFTKDYSTKDKTTGKYKEGGLGSAYFEFTTTNSTSYTFIINIGACTDKTVGNTEPTTLSDFSIHKNPNGIFAIKKWTSGTTWGSFYTDAVYADSIKLMGNQWRSQYCDLGVLEANTTYTLTYKFAHGTKNVFQPDSNKNYSCGIINAPKTEIDAWFKANSSALNYEKTGFKNYVNEIGAVHKRTDTDETFTFTTDESKHYYLVVSLQAYSAEYPAGAQYITLYEPTLKKVGRTASVTVDGFGKAGVNKTADVFSGDTVEYTVDEGYAKLFNGWYDGTTLLSTSSVYSFEYNGTQNLHLTAKFSFAGFVNNFAEPTDALYTTSRILTCEVEEGALHLSTNSQGKEGSVFVRLNSAKLDGTKSYGVSFKYKINSGAYIDKTGKLQPNQVRMFLHSSENPTEPVGSNGNSGSLNWNTVISLTKTDDEWHTYTIKNFDYKNRANDYIWLQVALDCDLLIDDVTILEVDKSIEFKAYATSAGGTGTVSSNAPGLVYEGAKIELSAKPDDGSSFGGWYQSEKLLSKETKYTYICQSDAPLYAQFVSADSAGEVFQYIANSNFDDGLNGWRILNLRGDPITSKMMTENGDNYVRLGKRDMISQTVAIENGYTYRIAVTSRADAKLVTRNGQYEYLLLSIAKAGTGTVRNRDCLNEGEYNFPINNFSYNRSQRRLKHNVYEGKSVKDGIKEFTTYYYEIANNTGKTLFADIVIGNGDGFFNPPYDDDDSYLFPGDLDVTSVTVSRFSAGVSNYSPEKLYGEEFYNLAQNYNFSKQTTNADWGAPLPAGWQVKTENNNNYLSVKNSTKTYDFEVVPGVNYLVAANLRTNSNGNSCIEILDSNGVLMGDSVHLDSRMAVLRPQANNTWQRLGYEIYVPYNASKIYLRIVGENNVLDIDNITVVRTRNTTLTDMNITPPADLNYSTAKKLDPMKYYDIDAIDAAAGEKTGDSALDFENVATGDALPIVLPIVLFAVSGSFVLVFVALRKRKLNKGEKH